MDFRRIIAMRNLLLAGTAGLFLAIGAASAYAVPQNSPYATMVPPDAVDGYSGSYGEQGPIYADPGYDGMTEGRAAYVDPEYANDDPGYVDPGYGYGYAAPVGGLYFGGGNGGHFHGGHFGGGMRHMR
jgi:hypothetical protein